MPNNKFSILHTPAGLSTPVTDISDAVQINEHEGIRATADSFGFTVQAKEQYQRYAASGGAFFNDGDRIRIYLSTGNDTPQLVMDGVVKEIVYNASMDRQTYTISGQNLLEILLNAPIPAKYHTTDTINTAPKIVKNVVNQALGQNKNAKYTLITNISAELKSLGGFIDDQTNTISAIGTNFARVHTPAFQMVEELSTWKWTGLNPGVGSYIFYLDSSNNFHWEPRSNTIGSTIRVGDCLNVKITKTIFDVINYAIINCGKDFNGVTITTYAFRPTYMVKGIKGKYFVNEQLASSLKDPLSNNMPNGNKDIDGNTDNATFRTKVQTIGKAWGESILQVFGAPRFQAVITMKGTTEFTKGTLYNVEVPGVFRDIVDAVQDSIPLRLREITHTLNSRGWTTQLTLIQDEITITGAGTL